MTDILDQLSTTIEARRDAAAPDSYVARLLGKGRAHVARKLGEEAVETIVAALDGADDDGAALTAEAADLVFHLMILLADAGLSIDDVKRELERREGVSGLDEKAARNTGDTDDR